MLCRRHILFIEFLKPIRIGKSRAIVVPLPILHIGCCSPIFRLARVCEFAIHILLDIRHRFIAEYIWTASVNIRSIEISGKLQWISHLGHLCRGTETNIAGVINLHLTGLPTLSRNQDYTKCSTRTIDRSRSGIFQNRHTFYIIRIQRIQISLYTIN